VTESNIAFALVYLFAICALAGWTTLLVILTRSWVPLANSLSTLHKIDSLIDDRIYKTVQRIQEKRNVPTPPVEKSRTPEPTTTEAALNELFGAAEPFGEQPDDEVIET
jgi:hypothetical protein